MITPETTKKRIAGIELFRLAAAFAIILRHIHPFYYSTQLFITATTGPTLLAVAGLFIFHAVHFAVPFFFLAAGYFLGKKVLAGERLGRILLVYIKRLMTIWLFWSLLYILIPHDPAALEAVSNNGYLPSLAHEISSLRYDPLKLVFAGGEVHLWFLPALAMALCLAALFIKLNMKRAMIPVAVLIYCSGLLVGTYSGTPAGKALQWFPVMGSVSFLNNGYFISMLFVALGFLFSERTTELTRRIAIGLIVVGLVTSFLEVFNVWRMYGAESSLGEYGIGTVPLSAGIFLYALHWPEKSWALKVSSYGKFSLGIYVVHFFFVPLFYFVDGAILYPYGDVLYPFAVFFLSLAIVLLLTGNKVLRRFVS